MLLFPAFAVLLSALVDGGPEPSLNYFSFKIIQESPDAFLPPPSKHQGGQHIWGAMSSNDRLLFSKEVTADKSYFKKVEEELEFEGEVKEHATIYYIEVTDQTPKKNGGSVSIKRGGLTYRYVTLGFESEKGKSMNFNVKIYGH